MQAEPGPPVLIDVGEATVPLTQEVTVVDVLVGAFSFTGVIVAVAVLLALLFAGGLIWVRRSRGARAPAGGDAERPGLGLHLSS